MKDLFSNHAADYASFRPTYPKKLYDFILSHVDNKDRAWDCGTGNGQVAIDLCQFFQQVEATDISTKQIENAWPATNINYSVCPSEKTPFKDASFDLITVAQAIHWFNFHEFYNEVKRVSKPEALLAVWGYGLVRVTPVLDKLIDDFYANLIGPYWDVERKLIDDHYSTIPFPFKEIQSPSFEFFVEWTLAEFQGYLLTWSAVQKFIKANNSDPVTELILKIKPHFGETQRVYFPLFLRAGRIM